MTNPYQGQWLGQQAQAAQQFTTPHPYAQPSGQGWSPPVTGASLAIGGADAPQSAGTAPTITHMMMQPGRLVAIIPMKIERGVKAPGEGKTQDRITADVLIIDGGPITYGGRPWARPPLPDTHVIQQLPYLATNVWISNSVLVTQLERKVGNGIVVGRLYYGEAKNGNNAPYKISEDPTPEELAFVTQWWAAYQAGQFQNPSATPLQQQPVPQQAPVMQQPATVGAPVGWGHQPPALGVNIPQSVQAFTAPQAPPAPWGTPAAPGTPQVSSTPPAPEQDWTLTTFPPGFPDEHKPFWATQATKDQRLALLAQHGITGPGVPPTGL